MLARAVNGECLAIQLTTAFRHRDRGPPREIIRGQRPLLLDDLRRTPGSYHLSAMLSGARAKVDHVIGSGDHLQIVLDHEDGVAQVPQSTQDTDHAAGIARVKADRRLIQHIQHAAQTRAQQRRQPQTLRLPCGESRRGTLQGQIPGAHFHQPLDALAQFYQDRFAKEHILRAKSGGERPQPVAEIREW